MAYNTITGFDDKCIMIKIRQETVDIKKGSVYEAVRHCWKARKDRAEQADYVLAVINGVVKGVYEPTEWYYVDDEECKKINCGTKGPCGRIAFLGEEADNAVKGRYLNKNMPSELRGGQNPIKYINI